MQGNDHYEVKMELLRYNRRGWHWVWGSYKGILFIITHPTRWLCCVIFWVCIFKFYDKKFFK